MFGTFTKTTDSAALIAATGGHPYVRLSTRRDDVLGYIGPSVTVWRGGNRLRRALGAVGDGVAALDVVVGMIAEGTVEPGLRAEMPRMDHGLVHAVFPGVRIMDWDLRWLESTPPVTAASSDVVVLNESAYDEINAVLDAALPAAHNRPGSARVRQWYGIRSGGDLVAVAADSSSPGFGFINSVAVLPTLHGRGLGSAITSELARRQLAETDTVLLGVMADNVGASRLYGRLGFTGLHEMTAFTLP
jgi:ribosomal protein S18 acetylase RimI-like enzyme